MWKDSERVFCWMAVYGAEERSVLFGEFNGLLTAAVMASAIEGGMLGLNDL